MLLVACADDDAHEPAAGTSAPSTAPAPPTSRAPTQPPVRVCGNADLLLGPDSPPPGAIVVPPGDNSRIDWTQAGTTYWLAPGVHTLGGGEFDQIIPGRGATFIGGPGAVLDGRRMNRYAFTQQAPDVRIAYLTIRGFGRGADNHNEAVVNHDAGDDWIVEHNTIADNDGAGVFLGDGNVLRSNCLQDNGQYGFSAYEPDGVRDVSVEGNEIVGNNRDDWETRIEDCGCSGGAKFWDTEGAVVAGNWVHDNHGPGLWADYNNRDFVFERNYFEGNADEALFYEVSYNAVIRHNTFRRNAIGKGQRFAEAGDLFPVAAVYISESGGDSRVAGPPAIEVFGNVFHDNWSGITVWENADRYCGNGATPGCTLNTTATESSCVQPGISQKPLYDDCRWKSRNVKIYDNEFRVTPANIACEALLCARQSLLSNHGTWPPDSPYQGAVIQDAITFRQGNVWARNRYIGPWVFVAHDLSTVLDFDSWQADPYGQDVGSTLT
ncbi:MAG TPA: right-handed parallel beta-helix repeat-containing protein [Acidimicrobiales bacterium]|nr:right-handed parallel beta-helix repeat-containing protein [Acidimicrobiales bacterium]